MKYKILNNDNKDDLILFFAGFAQDEKLLSDVKSSKSLYLIYDYSDLSFDTSLISNFKNIYIVAWSMGICVANYFVNVLLHNKEDIIKMLDNKVSINVKDTIALNGTNMAIDDKCGILNKIYNHTVDNLDAENFKAFLVRMCGSDELYAQYSSKQTTRSILDLKNELIVLRDFYMQIKDKAYENIFNKVFICKKDSIFLYRQQDRYWKSTNAHITVEDTYHYDALLINKIIDSLENE